MALLKALCGPCKAFTLLSYGSFQDVSGAMWLRKGVLVCMQPDLGLRGLRNEVDSPPQSHEFWRQSLSCVQQESEY